MYNSNPKNGLKTSVYFANFKYHCVSSRFSAFHAKLIYILKNNLTLKESNVCNKVCSFKSMHADFLIIRLGYQTIKNG